jgi:hypothetical protein
VNHRSVLDVARPTDPHVRPFGPDHAVWPETTALAGADAPIDARRWIDIGRPLQPYLWPHAECHDRRVLRCPGGSSGIAGCMLRALSRITQALESIHCRTLYQAQPIHSCNAR